MQRAIALSENFTVALKGQQADALKALDDHVKAVNAQIHALETDARHRVRALEGEINLLKIATDDRVKGLCEIRNGLLELRARLGDGDDDMAKAFATVRLDDPAPVGDGIASAPLAAE